MKRVLVTGGAGFIGANFVHYWLQKYPADYVVVLDALTYAGNLASLEPVLESDNFKFVRGNILDLELVTGVLGDNRIDTIVHFAAESHVDRSIHAPDAFIETNVMGTHTMLKAAKAVWLDGDNGPAVSDHRFHHVSTDEVYGTLGPDEPPFTEETPYAPNSPYSASKAASDHLVRSYHHTYGLQVSTSNCSNNYGPYQFPEKLIPLVVINILSGRDLPIYGDGLNIRDWLYVEDHCRGIDLVLKKGRIDEVYNIGGSNEWTNIEIVRLVCGLLDDKFGRDETLSLRFSKAPQCKGKKAESLITFIKDRPGHDRRYAIDPAKCRRELGYEPGESFETGIRKTVDWIVNNQEWWGAVMDGSYRQWLKTNYQPPLPKFSPGLQG